MITVDEEQIGRGSGYIMSADCDSFYKAKVSHYFGISQEAAGVHAAVKGCGLKKMMDEEGRTWMILRTRMKLGRMADWMDTYRIETWCQEGYRLFCPRIVRAFGEKDELLFETQNHWVIMNVRNGRPERPSYVDSKLLYPDKEKYWFDPAFPKFPSEEEFQGEKLEDYAVSVNYYDYDYNRHVNNISYVNWMMEAFPFEFQNEYRPENIDVEWKKQCHYGDKLTVETTRDKENPLRFFTSIKREGEDGTKEVAFHAVSEWIKK
ncbi:MAG: hypothetical protein KBS81_08525 [Spirochaetales bacterium]|nr:hypothetical protein [Candidatus Physcosoma equi]